MYSTLKRAKIILLKNKLKEEKMNILLIGNGAREHAIAEAIMRSKYDPKLFVYMKTNNPGIAAMADTVEIGGYADLANIKNFTQDHNVKLAIIGPEDPLANGAADALEEVGIPTVGPHKKLAKLETSKIWTRDLLTKYYIPGNPEYFIYTASQLWELNQHIMDLDILHRQYVLKPDGLTGGKGVQVQGDHFTTRDQAMAIVEEMFKDHERILLEEKLEGEEFSLQCLTDGKTVVATPPVQDHKRRLVGDKGLNTGGMGSYSCANHSLPFLQHGNLVMALHITRLTAQALHKETGKLYKGIMYGGFINTAQGVKLIEWNARFCDPEAMNVLPILKTDFIDICLAIVDGTLGRLNVQFENLATVCKYIVPVNYGLPEDQHTSVESNLIQIGDLGKATLYHSSISGDEVGMHMTSSRAVAVLGIASNLAEAEAIAEKGANAITGTVAHRSDVGTAELIAKRVQHMEDLKKVNVNL